MALTDQQTSDSPTKAASRGRFSTTEEIKRIVWTHAAGHCELCGTDLMHDYRVGQSMKWGEVAHIMPASPKGPRGQAQHDAEQAQVLTNDPANLMLLCPSCHDKIDRDAEGYPEQDLSHLHQAHCERIRLAASTPEGGRAIALIVQSQHFSTQNEIGERAFLTAMSAEGLAAFGHPVKLILDAPGPAGRDAAYWKLLEDKMRYQLEHKLSQRGGSHGDAPALAVVGLADMPALVLLGQCIGDRSNRALFSYNREHGLSWPDPGAAPPEYLYTAPPEGDGPLALVLSISAQVPDRDVLAALPEARIATLTISEPSYAMVKNRGVIHAFRDALQIQLSRLEAMTAGPIHVFPAAPAALMIEFGALLTTEHRHPYLIFDRDRNDQDRFKPALPLGPSSTTGEP